MNKDKNGNNCHDKRKHFSLFVLSIHGKIGREALVVLEILSRLMVAKMDEPILHVQCWINGRIEIAVARSYSLMICGSGPRPVIGPWVGTIIHAPE